MDHPAPGRRRAPSRHPAGAAQFAVLVAVLALVAACGSPAPTGNPAAAATDTPAPAASFTGGPASAHLDSPTAAAWTGGWCTRATADLWLAVNIGDPNTADYFGLVVGADPHGAPDSSPAAGGGQFRGDAATVTWRHGGSRSVITRDSATIVLSPDLSGGTFSGQLADGTKVQGSFDCPGSAPSDTSSPAPGDTSNPVLNPAPS